VNKIICKGGKMVKGKMIWKNLIVAIVCILIAATSSVYGKVEKYPQLITQFEFQMQTGTIIVTADDFKEMSAKDLNNFVTFLILNKSTKPSMEIIGVWSKLLIPDLVEKAEEARKEKK